MKYSYRSTLVNRETGRAKNLLTPIDTETWLKVARTDELGLYGNSAEVVEEAVLPLLVTENFDELSGVINHLDGQWNGHNETIIFQLAMFVWAGYKAGRYSANTWATVLGNSWQSGSRGMMAAVKLTQSEVIEMFREAPRKALLNACEFEGEDLGKMFDELPEEFQVFRGISTAVDHLDDGFSWTLDVLEARTFAALNCQTKKEIPGFVIATIRKEAVLGMFSFEKEVVVDPTVTKVSVDKYFLRGNELRNFHSNIDVVANTEDVLFNTGYHQKRMASGTKPAQTGDVSQAMGVPH